MMDLTALLRQEIDLSGLMLTRKQKQIIQYILDHPAEICYISLKELSRRAQCTEVTLLRLCQRLGFSGFGTFKQEFRRCYEEYFRAAPSPVPADTRDSRRTQQLLICICQRETQHIGAYLATVDLEAVVRAARMIAGSEYTLLLGRGLSKSIIEFLSYRLSLLGIRTIVVNPDEINSLQGRAETVDCHTTVVAVTFPSYMEALPAFLRQASEKGAQIISITDEPSSPIAPCADTVIYCPMARGLIYLSYASVMEAVNLLAHSIAIERGVGHQKHKEAELDKLRSSVPETEAANADS